jgi:hypothetical protein
LKRIHDVAVENRKKMASWARGDSDVPPLPCPLQGRDDVCAAFTLHDLCVADRCTR